MTTLHHTKPNKKQFIFPVFYQCHLSNRTRDALCYAGGHISPPAMMLFTITHRLCCVIIIYCACIFPADLKQQQAASLTSPLLPCHLSNMMTDTFVPAARLSRLHVTCTHAQIWQEVWRWLQLTQYATDWTTMLQVPLCWVFISLDSRHVRLSIDDLPAAMDQCPFPCRTVVWKWQQSGKTLLSLALPHHWFCCRHSLPEEADPMMPQEDATSKL